MISAIVRGGATKEAVCAAEGTGANAEITIPRSMQAKRLSLRMRSCNLTSLERLKRTAKFPELLSSPFDDAILMFVILQRQWGKNLSCPLGRFIADVNQVTDVLVRPPGDRGSNSRRPLLSVATSFLAKHAAMPIHVCRACKSAAFQTCVKACLIITLYSSRVLIPLALLSLLDQLILLRRTCAAN